VIYQSPNLRVERDDVNLATLWLDVQGQRYNLLNKSVLDELDQAITAVRAEKELAGLVIRSAKETGFLAGADIQGFTKLANPDDAQAMSAHGQGVFGRLVDLSASLPTTALVEGPCLGGGLELALACTFRLAVDRSDTQMGLPEVELGLLPGWGGTQRLPRLIGLERALQVILGGKRLNARQAKEWGLADRVLDPAETSQVLAKVGLNAISDGRIPLANRPPRTWRQRLLESNPLGRKLIVGGTERLLRRKVPDDMPAPKEALEAVKVGLSKGMEAGLAFERAAAGRLATTPACRNLVGLFLRREAARKLPAELRDKAAVTVRKVGVVGAGTMGAGIAQLAAVKGFAVVVQEANVDALQKGILRVGQLVEQAIKRRVLTEEEARQRLGQVKFTSKWEGFDDVDLVVEAVFEDPGVKRTVFHELESRTPATAVLATNTSSLLVGRFQEGLLHPGRFGGLHFFNPVHKMPLVEVIRGGQTDDGTAAVLAQFAASLGKTPALVKDGPGFLVNRILIPYLNEAVLLVAEGMGTAEVDGVMRRFGMPMGPLELLDQVGLDVAAHINESIRPALAGRFADGRAFEQMAKDRGWLGQKSGKGFYQYRGSSKAVNAEAEAALRSAGDKGLLAALPPAVRQRQARDRMVLLMVNEASRCLSEGVIDRADNLDLAMVLGTGWAPHRGGPLSYARDRGVAEVVKALGELAGRHGPRVEPHPGLKDMAG
jgi:3-hydroxyacyl-CoA dehydrogenase / enoyl-CoA hydratase / 3-hydroxybutyryl-CoA epimerase